MPVVEPSLVEEKKPKKEFTAVKKKKKKRKRESDEGKRRPKSNSQEYLEMEMAGAMSREEDQETGRRLTKKRKVGKGKLGGDNRFDHDFGSIVEKKTNDLNIAVDSELDQKKGKKKMKKDAIELEALGDGGFVMGEENGGSVCEPEDKIKSDKKKRKKKKKKADTDAMELEEPDIDMGQWDDRVVCESEKCSVILEGAKQLDMSKGEDKKRKGKKKRKESDNVTQDVGKNTQAAGDVNSGNKERKRSKDKNEAGKMGKEKVAQQKDKGKRVRFTDAVEVLADGVDDEESDQRGVDDENGDEGSESKFVHGKRFTPEEDAKLMEALMNYAEMKQLGQKGLEMFRVSAKHPELRGCWAEIAKALPHRPQLAIYKRARILLSTSTARKWTEKDESKFVHGKRFTPEEDATLMEAMMNYAEMKQLGEKGLEMIRASVKHPELRGCWAEIAKALPHRPQFAIYKRARILLYRSATRKWTEEEYEIIRRFVETNGPNWTKLAAELGKSDIHVKDAWRRIKSKKFKKGTWTQDEYQNLFDLVNLDLRVKSHAHQKIDQGHRIIRENISWEAISDKLTTRNNKDCCLMWYKQLASPLVKQGVWADADDYLLVAA